MLLWAKSAHARARLGEALLLQCLVYSEGSSPAAVDVGVVLMGPCGVEQCHEGAAVVGRNMGLIHKSSIARASK